MPLTRPDSSPALSGATRRVLMTADAIGGVWTYALELTISLANHGVEVVLATMGSRLNSEQRRQARAIPNLDLHESTFKLEWMEDPWADVERAGDWLLELQSKVRSDVVHLNGFAHGVLPWRTPVLMVGHSCVLSWWKSVRSECPPGAWNVYREKVGEGLRAADLVVAPSHAMLQALHENYGSLPSSRVIPNGLQAATQPASVKEPFVFAAGRLWDEAKNIKAVARAAANLPWPVYVAGETRNPSGSPENFEHVCPIGHVSSEVLLHWLSRASIFVSPARYEPFGLTILEAAQRGNALVLGDIPSLRENWETAAVFVDPDDPAGLKSALVELISNSAWREELGRRALQRSQSFSSREMASSYVRAYNELKVASLNTAFSPLPCAL
jgi:glycogen(starch) synthase